MSYQGSTVLQIKRDINFSSTDLYHCICELGKWVCVCGAEGWGGGGKGTPYSQATVCTYW